MDNMRSNTENKIQYKDSEITTDAVIEDLKKWISMSVNISDPVFIHHIILQRILDLIEYQKAEKEALVNGQETLQKYIAEQKAEISKKDTEIDILIRKNETLKDEVESLKEEKRLLDKLYGEEREQKYDLLKQLAVAKSEARKEFWERLKEKKCAKGSRVIYVDRIIETLKEMEGEE